MLARMQLGRPPVDVPSATERSADHTYTSKDNGLSVLPKALPLPWLLRKDAAQVLRSTLHAPASSGARLTQPARTWLQARPSAMK